MIAMPCIRCKKQPSIVHGANADDLIEGMICILRQRTHHRLDFAVM